jgi:hypothetical protein
MVGYKRGERRYLSFSVSFAVNTKGEVSDGLILIDIVLTEA